MTPPDKKITLFTDGASRGNPGPAACGFALLDSNGNSVYEGGSRLGNTTNNVAEYQGVLQGLEKCLELGMAQITVKSDSQLLVRQLSGQYKIKAPQLKPLAAQIIELKKKFEKVDFVHVPREENQLADSLANRALDHLI